MVEVDLTKRTNLTVGGIFIGHIRIMIIDYNCPFTFSARQFLTSMAAIEEVFIINDYSAALQAAGEKKPDIIILNRKLMGKDAFGLCHQLKTKIDSDNVKIFGLTLFGDQSSRKFFRDKGFDGMVSRENFWVDIMALIQLFV